MEWYFLGLVLLSEVLCQLQVWLSGWSMKTNYKRYLAWFKVNHKTHVMYFRKYCTDIHFLILQRLVRLDQLVPELFFGAALRKGRTDHIPFIILNQTLVWTFLYWLYCKSVSQQNGDRWPQGTGGKHLITARSISPSRISVIGKFPPSSPTYIWFACKDYSAPCYYRG